ncbi:MAG: hypothetical protein P4L50_01045 [Anaerolineaceae bacterium]|nr:hypothetical protein [Anaerolineaceae bacterium]
MTRKVVQFANLFLLAVLMLASQALTASASDHSITRISNAWNGKQADGSSGGAVISGDSRYILFTSSASNLLKTGLPPEPDSYNKLYLYDQGTGKTELVSVAADGSPANYNSGSSAISEDGRYVAFVSNATNNIAGYSGSEAQVYWRDRKTGKNYMVSGPLDGSLPSEDSNYPSISASGRYVAFESFSANLVNEDADDDPDIYVRDMGKNKLYLVSVSSKGVKGNLDSFEPSISADGRTVAFGSDATNLVAQDTNNGSDVFVHDLKTGKTERVSVSSNGKQGNDRSEQPVMSGNGRYVAFISWASNLVPGDTNGVPDVFVHDLTTSRTERVSVSSSGNQQTVGSLYDEGYSGLSLSFDGRFVTFVSQATNFAKGIRINFCQYRIGLGINEPCPNVYLRDRQTERTSIVSISSTNKSGNAASYSPNISQDGQWIAFSSDASNLAPGDSNGQSDIFIYHR